MLQIKKKNLNYHNWLSVKCKSQTAMWGTKNCKNYWQLFGFHEKIRNGKLISHPDSIIFFWRFELNWHPDEKMVTFKKLWTELKPNYETGHKANKVTNIDWRTTYKNGNICLWCPTNHVWHKTFVSRRIQNSEMFTVGFKEGPTNLYCFAFVSLFKICVQRPR